MDLASHEPSLEHPQGPACLGLAALGALSLIPSRPGPTGYLVGGKERIAGGQATLWEAPAAPSLRAPGLPELEALLGSGRKHPGQSQAGLPLAAPAGLGPEALRMLRHWGCDSTQRDTAGRQTPRTS